MAVTIAIEDICRLLEDVYGRPVWKPSRRLLDELVLTILSQHTAACNYNRAFANLTERFGDWQCVMRADVNAIEDAIRVGGLAKTKAIRIKGLLAEVQERFGGLNLDFVADMPSRDARALLMQFKGVGIKTASCTLMFSLNRPVLPVDTHVHRISRRLGLIGAEVNAEQAHYILGDMVPDNLVYRFHVDLVTHGRRMCKAQKPMCDVCPLLEICAAGPIML
jgi:endonuclease-3